jgi:hAT family C-terminal dimerisation region
VSIDSIDEDGGGDDPFLMGNDFDSPTKRGDPEENDDSGRDFEMFAAAVEREIGNYLDPLIYVSPNTDPLQWWRENRFRFPKIAIAARKWLCVPGTSTPSERVFSHCRIALSAKRSSMRGDALMNQILLKNNLPHILCTVEDVKKALSKFE